MPYIIYKELQIKVMEIKGIFPSSSQGKLMYRNEVVDKYLPIVLILIFFLCLLKKFGIKLHDWCLSLSGR